MSAIAEGFSREEHMRLVGFQSILFHRPPLMFGSLTFFFFFLRLQGACLMQCPSIYVWCFLRTRLKLCIFGKSTAVPFPNDVVSSSFMN